MRPALYNAYHAVEPVSLRPGPERQYELVGPICESADVVARDRVLPPLEVGDLVAIRDAGAYGSAMASNYNRHPLARRSPRGQRRDGASFAGGRRSTT